MGNKNTTTKETAETSREAKRGSTRASGDTGAELANSTPVSISTDGTVTSNILATFEKYCSNSYHRYRQNFHRN